MVRAQSWQGAHEITIRPPVCDFHGARVVRGDTRGSNGEDSFVPAAKNAFIYASNRTLIIKAKCVKRIVRALRYALPTPWRVLCDQKARLVLVILNGNHLGTT